MTRDKTLPTPPQLDASGDRVRLLLARIERDYAWLHDYAFSPPGNTRAGEGRNPGKPDPTGNAVTNGVPSKDEDRVKGLEAARVDLRAVAAHVDAMIVSLGNAAKTLRRYDYTRREVLALRETDRVASDAEVEAAREKQREREARGEGWGAA